MPRPRPRRRVPLEADVVQLLLSKGLTLACAESMTGGLLGARVTSVPGASDAFLGGFLTYTDEAKARLLGVDRGLLRKEGAVSAAVAQAMACACRERTGADLAVAITGLAGPKTPDGLPAGLTYLALAAHDTVTVVERRFEGGRAQVREAAVAEALRMVLAAAQASGKP